MLILRELNLPPIPLTLGITVLISPCLSQPPPASPLVSQWMMLQTLPAHSNGVLQRRSALAASTDTSSSTARKEVNTWKICSTLDVLTSGIIMTM